MCGNSSLSDETINSSHTNKQHTDKHIFLSNAEFNLTLNARLLWLKCKQK